MRLQTQKLRSGLLLTVIAAVSFASLEDRVTVAQLAQTLTADVGAHKPDAEMARQIAGIELSERLTETTLARLVATLHAGPQAALALQLLADQSVFLDPPASELPLLGSRRRYPAADARGCAKLCGANVAAAA